ncbi:MAG: ATP-binding protein [Acidobacteriia bacterium]|nr:ATP-binding protein [Terriglobia bacterium]
MTRLLPFSFKSVLIGLITVAVAVFGTINFIERTKTNMWIAPDDGVSWQDADQGIQAWIVESGSSGEKAGVQVGDILVSIEGHQVADSIEVTKRLFQVGVWNKPTYHILRHGIPIDLRVIVAPQDTRASFKFFLELVGLLYLLIGVFIFMRRWEAPQAVLFYAFCLTSFVLYTFSYTGKLNLFDWCIYWSNSLALILQPALFVHFCVSFPRYKRVLESRRVLVGLLYLPMVVLLGLQVAFITGTFLTPHFTLAQRWFLDRLDILYSAVYFLAGAASLVHTYRLAATPELRQQMRWITPGAIAAVVPFAVGYAFPYFLGVVPTLWMNYSVLPLILIPLTFGYAIIRYRLMDVDIMFKQGVAYTLATLMIIGVYFAVVAAIGITFSKAIAGSPVTSVITTVVAAFLFAPVRNWIQVRLDKFFYRERYDYRSTMIEFGRALGSEIHLDLMLNSVVDRLSQTLQVDRIAVFLRKDTPQGHFVIARARGIPYATNLDLKFLSPERPELRRGYLFYENFKSLLHEKAEHHASLRHLDLNYYIPCVAKDSILAVIGLSKTIYGDFLSREDLELLQTIAGYVGIAVENAQLYESLEQEALEAQRLKAFLENIVESINVGILTSDLDDRIDSWNSQMERFYGLRRGQALGRTLKEVFPGDLMRAVRRVYTASVTHAALKPVGDSEDAIGRIYKFNLRHPVWRVSDGGNGDQATPEARIVNIAVTPLIGRDHTIKGKLILFDDITDRSALEDQLMQSEKLTSIGLLAAGVAHEVNTPLAVISSYTQMLQKQLKPDDPMNKIVEKIIKQSFRASEIVNGLLSFSRTAGTQYSEVDCNKVINETLSLLEHQFKTAKVNVEKRLGGDLPSIHANIGKLQQVFLNLFLNAKDAMPSGGVLTITTGARNSDVIIEVADTGSGISTEHLKKIYDPFFTTKTGRGTGLGLSVSYGIIQEHSGKIDVESQPGQGTRFTLEFPALHARVAAERVVTV